MITPPPTWGRSLGHQVLTLVPPGGRGLIRYHERPAPRAFEDIVDELVAGDGGFRVTLTGPASRFVTEEGEYGAWCTLAGEDADGPVRRWIGAVLCDEFAAAIDGRSHESETDDLLHRTSRWLIQHASFGLGTRRRRFLYRRPPGWHGIASGLVTTFFPPDYPRHRAYLEVHPAEPSAMSPVEAFDAILADEQRRGLERSGAEQAVAVSSPGGLAGTFFTYAGRWAASPERRVHELAVLVDGRYRYVVRLETVGDAPADADRESLRALVASIEPLPRAGGRAAATGISAVTAPWLE